MADNFYSFFPLPVVKLTSPTGVVFLTFAEHHNIMQSLFLDEFRNVRPMFLELAQAGFDVRSFAANGTPLPGTQAAADIIGSAYHGGNHPALTEWVSRDLNIEARLTQFRDNNFGNMTKAQWLAEFSAQANGMPIPLIPAQ